MRRLRGWMPKSDTALRPCFWILCAAFGLGILLGQLAGRSLGVEQQDASRAVRAAARRRGIRGADRRAEAAAAGTRGHHIRGGVEGS